jgi:hypothetical protein
VSVEQKPIEPTIVLPDECIGCNTFNACHDGMEKGEIPLCRQVDDELEPPTCDVIIGTQDQLGCNKCDVQVGMSADDIVLQIYRNRSVMEANIIIKSTGEVIERIPVQWKSRENKLDYLSVSKIHAYEDCPACFYHQYMSDEGLEEDSGNFFTKFGSILHGVVEMTAKVYDENGIVLPPMQIYDEIWKQHDLADGSAYLEGKKLIEDYFARNPVDQRPYKTLFVEEEWRGELGGGEFGLQIDYAGIMKTDPTCGILSDYKTNRMPFTPSELEDSLQLRIYELVLRRHLAPDIKQWTTGYEMFRYGFQQCPPRSERDLQDAENYVANVRHQIMNDNVWEEKLNNYCGFRKCRFKCKTYADYVNNPKRYIDAIGISGANLEEIDAQRERMTTYEKVAKSRKEECANILKAAIEDAMKQNKALVIGGQELQLYSNGTGSYSYNDTKNVLLVNNALDLLDKCSSISKTKMDAALKGNPQLKMALSGCLMTNYASPYITKKKAK